MEAAHAISMRIEGNTDTFHRVALVEELTDVRSRISKMIRAETSDVVLVPNTMHGVNIVLHNFHWKADDVLIGCKLISSLLH